MLISSAAEVKHFCLLATAVKMPHPRAICQCHLLKSDVSSSETTCLACQTNTYKQTVSALILEVFSLLGTYTNCQQKH